MATKNKKIKHKDKTFKSAVTAETKASEETRPPRCMPIASIKNFWKQSLEQSAILQSTLNLKTFTKRVR